MPAPVASEAAAFSGRVIGGQQSIVGASISLYAAGTAGNGLGASSLLTAPVTSGAYGNFAITGDYACPASSTQVYLVARGGNPGLAAGTNNSAAVLMAALGDCGNLSPATFVNINEVTTVAAAWALAPFLGSGATVGASATNSTGLRNAFLVAGNLANTATGTAGGASLPAGATLETAKLYTLADILAVCVNSDGGTGCNPLLRAATSGTFVPNNTLDAALSIVRNPGRNVAAVFYANNAQTPFQPALAAAPNDWTMSLTYKGGGLYEPSAVAPDSTGSVWAANYMGGVATKLSATGVPASATGFADGHLNESYGLAVDAQDNAWVTNEENSGVNGGGGSVSKFSSTGAVLSGSSFYAGNVYYPYAIAADTDSSIWVADFGHSGATYLASDGSSLSGTAGYQPAGLTFPLGVAMDGQHNAWFAGQGSAVKVTRAGVSSAYPCCVYAVAVALDTEGNVWLADYSGVALVELSPAGVLLQRLSLIGGVTSPQGITSDGAGQIWSTNYHGNSFSGFTASSSASTAISPATGFGLDAGLSQPFGLAVDQSGNVWVASFASNALVEFVGLASPRKSPLLGLPMAP